MKLRLRPTRTHDKLATVDLPKFVLDAAAFVVESTSDANNAILQVSAFRSDLILMDIQMPGIDGLELAARLKADPSMRHFVVVAFTAFPMERDAVKMRAPGAVATSPSHSTWRHSRRRYGPTFARAATQAEIVPAATQAEVVRLLRRDRSLQARRRPGFTRTRPPHAAGRGPPAPPPRHRSARSSAPPLHRRCVPAATRR